MPVSGAITRLRINTRKVAIVFEIYILHEYLLVIMTALVVYQVTTSTNHIIRNAGSIYSKTATILKSMAASAIILHEANFWFKRFA